MTVPQSTIPDFIGLAVFVAAWFFSPEVAAVVGPYSAIAIAGAVGAGFRLSWREKDSRLGAAWWWLRTVLLVVIFTSIGAALIEWRYPALSPRLTAAPIAFGLGYLNWKTVLPRLQSFFFGLIDMARGNKGGPS